MSRARHHKKAEGGKVDSEENPKDVYAGKDSPTAKEAENDKEGGEMKKGGKVAKKKHGGKVEHKVEGEKAHRRLDRPERKRGGRIHKESGGACSNMSKGGANEDREDSFTGEAETPRRAKGGRVGSGSDMSPLTSASRYE